MCVCSHQTGLEDDNMLGKNGDGKHSSRLSMEWNLTLSTGVGLGGDKTGSRGDEDGSQSGLHSDASGRLGSRQSGSRPASTLDSRPGSSMKKFGVRGSARSRKRNFGAEVMQTVT